MTDSLGTILNKGWEDFKTNPVLVVPGLLTMILTYLFVFVIFFALFSSIVPLDVIISGGFADPVYLDNLNFDSFNFGQFFIIYFVSIIVLLIVSVFLSAGLTGMAKEAVITGKTKLGDMISYGVKYFFKYLLLNILLLIIMCVVIGIVSTVFMVFLFAAIAIDSTAAVILALLLVLLMVLFLIVLAVAITLFIYFATYALVLDDCGVIQSLKVSYRLFMDNKTEVLVFVGAMLVAYIVVSFIIQMFTFVLAFIPILGLVLIFVLDLILMSCLTALMTVWSVRKYYDLTSETIEVDVEIEGPGYSEYSRIEQGILDSDGPSRDYGPNKEY